MINRNFKRNFSMFAAAVALSASIIPGTALATGADNADLGKDVTGTIEIKNVEEGLTVTAYQVVEGEYALYDGVESLVKWKTVNGASIKEIDEYDAVDEGTSGLVTLNPTESEILSLAQDLYADGKIGDTDFAAEDKITLKYDEGSKSYTADVQAGSYIVLVSNTKNVTGEYVYNPMFVSVNYNNADRISGDVTGTDLSARSYAEIGTKGSAEKVTAYAKKSYTTLDKDIVSDGDSGYSGNTETESVAIGDTVDYKITTSIPVYTDAFTDLTFKVIDEETDSIGEPKNVEVYAVVGDTKTLLTENTQYTYTKAGNGFTIDFAENYIRSNPLVNIEITFSAEVTESLQRGVNAENTNTATLVYTTVPGSTNTYDDDVSLYSFDITALKVDASDTGKVLEGATFTLNGTTDSGKEIKDVTAVTGSDGIIKFTGLDVGTYTLQETVAPKGYYVNPTTYSVKIEAVYDEDADGSGALVDIDNDTEETRSDYGSERIVSYTVTITNNDTGDVVSTATYTRDKEKVGESGTSSLDATGFKALNTAISYLPSTGGVGTLAFILGGTLVIAGGIALGRKRSDKE